MAPSLLNAMGPVSLTLSANNTVMQPMSLDLPNSSAFDSVSLGVLHNGTVDPVSFSTLSNTTLDPVSLIISTSSPTVEPVSLSLASNDTHVPRPPGSLGKRDPISLGIFAACLGIFSSTLGLASLAADQFTKLMRPPAHQTWIRIYAGLDHAGGLNGASGELPDTTLWGHYGDKLGYVWDPGNFLNTGAHQDYWITHYPHRVGQQAFYSLLTGNNDAICIAYATMTWAGESGHLGAMIGDFGRECSKLENSWYYSGVMIPNTNIIPSCFWIDKNGDHPYTALSLNWVDMQSNEEDVRLGRNVTEESLGYDLCDSPTFSLYTIPDYKGENPPIPMWSQPGMPPDKGRRIIEPPPSPPPLGEKGEPQQSKRGRSGKKQKRSTIQRFSDTVVVETYEHHTARALCEDWRSAGPNFVNLNEGLFCEMTTRTLYPVCKTTPDGQSERNVQCFDVEQMLLVGPGMTKRSAPYKVQDWTAQRAQMQE